MQERIISGRHRDEDDDDEPEIYADGSGGSGSRVGGEAQSRRFSNVGDYFTHISVEVPVSDQQQRQRKRSTGVTLEEVDPNIYSQEHGKQTRIDDAYNQQGPRYKVGRAVAKWWHHSIISFNAANSPYYKTMIQEVQRHGLHVQPPSLRDLAGRYLDEEVHEIKSYIQSFKKKWEKYGCTLMCDDWSGNTKSSLINFLVYCDRQVFYHKSIDASDRVHQGSKTRPDRDRIGRVGSVLTLSIRAGVTHPFLARGSAWLGWARRARRAWPDGSGRIGPIRLNG
ncbi:hypothetical protein Taro_034817 [Colocasia esculenta]|uniref:DUF659 domain-containing protein n=1 Tax=Colocasia esculenta TaxID=4460 RepID=A0A843W1Y7_COLES|nr:hypothetical protein [Colocasia esculenta]